MITPAPRTPGRRGPLLVAILLWWGLGLAVGAVASIGPAAGLAGAGVTSLPEGEPAFFHPDGMLLIETLRLRGLGLAATALPWVVSVVAGAVAGLLGLAVVLAAATGARGVSGLVGQGLRRVVPITVVGLLVAPLQAVALAVSAGILALGLYLSQPGGPEELLVPALPAVVIAGALLGALQLWLDLTRGAVALGDGPLTALAAAARTVRSRPASTALPWLTLLVARLQLGALGLYLLTRWPLHAPGPGPDLAMLALGQGVALGQLVLRTWWLTLAVDAVDPGGSRRGPPGDDPDVSSRPVGTAADSGAPAGPS